MRLPKIPRPGPPKGPRLPTTGVGHNAALLPGAVIRAPEHRPVLVLDAYHYTPGRAPWDALIAGAYGADSFRRAPIPPPVAEDDADLEEAWELVALRDAYGDALDRASLAHSRMTSVLVDRTAPAMRRTRDAIPPPSKDEPPSVETGQWSRRKTDR